MKANNLTISVPNAGCDKNCPYCVSRMTGYYEADCGLIKRNTPKVMKLAETAGVSSVLLTGKGEPLLNLRWIKTFCRHFASYPLEVQTNGIIIADDFKKTGGKIIRSLHSHGMDTIAFSIDRISGIDGSGAIFSAIKRMGMTVRVTFIISDIDRENTDISFRQFLDLCRKNSVSQVSLRKLTIPEIITGNPESVKTASWIREHCNDILYERWTAELLSQSPRIVRELPFGAMVYDMGGIAVTYFDYCIQEKSGSEDIRSLIFQEDGHLYTAWDSGASILF